jgi:hypothetical protein
MSAIRFSKSEDNKYVKISFTPLHINRDNGLINQSARELLSGEYIQKGSQRETVKVRDAEG